MRRSGRRRFARAGWLLVLALACGQVPVAAQVARTLRLDSRPSGATVYLLRGDQRLPLGVTPMAHRAEFRSEHSILRFGFEHPGGGTATLEAMPSDSRLLARLATPARPARGSRAGPIRANDPIASELAARVQSALAGASGVRLGAAPRLARSDGASYAVVPLLLADDWPGARAGAGAARRLWQQAGTGIAGELRRPLAGGPTLAGVVLDARLDAGGTGAGFAVGQRMTPTVDMVCSGGTRQVYDACARQVPTYETSCNGATGFCSQRQTGTRCQGGSVARFDPCANRVARTRFVATADPTATVAGRRARIVILAGLAPGEDVRAARHTDAAGRLVHTQGRLPAGLAEE